MSIEIFSQPTPNPNALKFILDKPVKEKGNSTFITIDDCKDIPMAQELFKVRGVDKVHFFENSITITKFNYEDWEVLEPKIEAVLNEFFPNHNPDYIDLDPEEERRKRLSKELQDIESVLDKTIRPGLQADGGDLQCLEYTNNVLIIEYQGACGNCPSSQAGTLHAIQNILRQDYNPEIEVYAQPAY